MKYILGVDDGHDTLQDITKAISMELGPRKIKSVPLEDAMFHKEITVSCVHYICTYIYDFKQLYDNILTFEWPLSL